MLTMIICSRNGGDRGICSFNLCTLRRAMPPLVDRVILAKWEARLGLSPTRTYRVKRSQITSSYKRLSHIAGYCEADDTIYYSRKLDEWTIVHELLHKKYPELSHREVKKLTDETMSESKI